MTEFTREFIEFHKLCLEQYIGTEEFVWNAELALDTLNEIERLQKVISEMHSDHGYDLDHIRDLQDRLDSGTYL